MYEDAWYSFNPEPARKGTASSQGPGHRRKESLLQQPNGTNHVADVAESLENVYEEVDDTTTPPEPTIVRRAASYSDFYRVVKAQLAKDRAAKPPKASKKRRQWDALALCDDGAQHVRKIDQLAPQLEPVDAQLLEASQEKYLLYCDQLALTERHLENLIGDTDDTLKLLASLSNSFQSVEAQTSSFRSQCEDLLDEQRRLEKLADDVGTDLHYYEYLDTATRRLNAPGASRLIDDETFGTMVENIDACIEFMESHDNYRDRDSYLARYNALLTKALHLLDHGFTSRLDKISSEISRQIAATQSESARHALAFGRFEEMIMDSFSLVPNVKRVVRQAFDRYGRRLDTSSDVTVYATTAENLFRTYLTARDRDLKLMTQHDLDVFHKEIKSTSVETACRNLIKQSFERLYDEEGLFAKVFSVELMWNTSPESCFQAVKSVHTSMIHPGHLAPLATNLQSTLQTAQIQTVCNIVGWLASEYSVSDSEEDESPFQRKCREYAARLLVESLWPFTDGVFEAEITKSLTRATIQDASLKIGPVEGGVASSNAFPLVKQAIKLLAMFDQAMPKERSSRDSPVVFKIVRESIQVLQRAESRIRAIKTDTDPDLFMVKNLLIIKNELLSLEIGDVRSQTASMQHFGQIWDTLSPGNWVGFFSGMIGGSLWSRGAGAPSVSAKTMTVEDMNEQLDELLRQSIYAFTKSWGALLNDSRARKTGVKPIAKVEAQLEMLLENAFSNQPEVIAKLNEAIQQNAQAQKVGDGKTGAKRY